MIIVVGIIYILYHLIKEANEDSYLRDAARRNGSDWYPSCTGFRDVQTNKKYLSEAMEQRNFWSRRRI